MKPALATARQAGDGIEVRSLLVRRGGRTVLHDVDLTAHAGRTVGIIGPNGAGKSTLLKAIHRELERDAGSVVVAGDDVTRLSRRELARRMAVVAQDQEPGLPLSVADVVMLGRLPHRTLVGYGDAADRAVVRAALARVDLLGLADRLVDQVSGGERQRVLIARAIAQQAGHLLLDEPTNHLDLHHQFVLLDLVRSLAATTVVVLHDLNLAARSCDDLLLLDRGRVVAAGPSDRVLDPELVSRVYRVHATALDHHGRRHLLFDAHPTHEGDS